MMVFISNGKLNPAKITPPNIDAYKIPHLHSQFPPNPTPTNRKDPHPATYKSIHAIDIPPNLT